MNSITPKKSDDPRDLSRSVPTVRPAEPLPPDKPRQVALGAPKSAGPSVRPPVRPGRLRRRHVGVLLSFLLLVVLPLALSAWYLWVRAVDQYASTVAFSVRTEEVSSAIELLGGITDLSSSSTSDADILYEFIQSQRLVADIDGALDLRALWSWPENDPVFVYDGPGTIEDLVAYWERMIRVSHDVNTGLIEIRALAFRPQDAQNIAQAVYDQSSDMINALSAIAQEDAIRYARDELDETVARLKDARRAITAFRNQYQIVNPEADLQSQSGLLGALQLQLTDALIDQDMLLGTTRENDPRITRIQRRIEVIETRIAEERRKYGIGDANSPEGEVFADLVGEFESLTVDREFAEQSYTAALASYDAAQAEARRKSRYLAAYILPTLPEKAQYPQREVLLTLIGLFVFMLWGILALVYYSLRDRR